MKKLNQIFFAVKNKNDEIRLNSSSGGVFNALATYIIKNGGVVYGAIYDLNFNIIHKRIDKLEDIYMMQGSKYSNSNMASIINQLKKDAEDNVKVLFSGTPCQIKAVKNILSGYNINNFLFVDIICHGTPNKHFFDDYKKIMEKRFNSKLVCINMRHKDKKEFYQNTKYVNPCYKEKIGKKSMFLKFDNGKEYFMPSCLDVFYLNFDYFMNNSCFQCKFSNMNRLSDITIGDFHQFNCNLGTFNDCNGVSLVILNSQNGLDIFNCVRNNFEYLEKSEEEIYQPALYTPTVKPQNYDEFQNDYKNFGFDFVIKKYTPISIKYKLKVLLYRIGLYEKIKKVKMSIGEKNENKD